MTEQELIEELADKEHASWARWMQYLFSRCEEYLDVDGYEHVIIPRELVDHWQRQIDTPYALLSEQEKQSDRNEVAHILPIIKEYATKRELHDDVKALHNALNEVLSLLVMERGTDYNCVQRGLAALARHPELPTTMALTPLIKAYSAFHSTTPEQEKTNHGKSETTHTTWADAHEHR